MSDIATLFSRGAIGVFTIVLISGSSLSARTIDLQTATTTPVPCSSLPGTREHCVADTSAGVVLGLLAVAATGWLWLDPVIAIAVAGNVAREGWSLVRRSTDGLMDRAVEPAVQQQIDAVLAGFAHPTTLRFDHVVTRRAGQRRFVDLHMHMPPGWTLQRAAALRTSVEQALMAEVPGLRATIQLLPMDVEAHFDDKAEHPL